MKIAIVAPAMVPIPPPKYGGIEQIVDLLARGMAERGHQITVFCCGGSKISGKNIRRIETSPYPAMEDLKRIRMWEEKEILTVLSQEKDFDVIHFNYEPIILRFEIDGKSVNLLDRFSSSVALTFHNSTDVPLHQKYYRSAESLYRHTVVFVSENQHSRVPFFPNSKVIYNGIPVEKFPMEKTKDNYFFFLGRINPIKGVLEAIETAKRTNTPLVIAAPIDKGAPDFYEKEVKPLIDGSLIRYIGEADFSTKTEYLKRARALLFPILWEEPFGLVMVEALACGTPVIAFRRGSVPEIIQDGVNGFVVDNVDGMVRAAGKLGEITAAQCRKSAERFSAKRMVEEYESLFSSLVNKKHPSE